MFARRSIIVLAIRAKPELNFKQTRTSFYNKYRHGPQKITNPDINAKYMFNWYKGQLSTREGRKKLKDEFVSKLMWPFKVEFNKDATSRIDKTEIFEHFDSDEAIRRWKPVCDRDGLNGYSTSHLTRSPSGHALFHGVIDNTLPDDGLTANAGFSAIIGPKAPATHIFKIEPFWDWSKYNCFEIKFRGDGRKYDVILNRGSAFDDLGYYDNYAHPIHTRGGPYWQTMRIPFTKWVYNYKSYVQDRQGYLPAHKITFVAIAIHDKVDGPFALEIDYMGLRFDQWIRSEHVAYEMYKVKHLRWRPLSVESPPPQVE